MSTLQRTEFASAVAELARERHIDPEVVINSIKEAILAAFRRDAQEDGSFNEDWEYSVELDEVTGKTEIYALDENKKKRLVTPPGFGRIAAQVAKQVIVQKIREAEKSAILDDYRSKTGTLVLGTIIRLDANYAVVDIGRTYGILPKNEQIPQENYRVGSKFDFLIKEVGPLDEAMGGQGGERVILSRRDPEMVAALLKREVPEVANGAVELKGIAREAGVRTKVAVFSSRRSVDPVGACVGQKGVRIAEIIRVLGGEKVDVIQFSNNVEKFIAAALLPAENLDISVDKEKKTAFVLAPADQLPLAIGRDGHNVRLASELTGYEIEVKKGKEKKEEAPKEGKAKKEKEEKEKMKKEANEDKKNKEKKAKGEKEK